MIKYKKGDIGERPWGKWCVDEIGNGYIKKTIIVNPVQQLSLQSHEFRAEKWEIIEGTAEVTLDGAVYILKVGQTIDIPLRSVHRLQNPEDNVLKILETQYGETLDENDIIRYDDVYGREVSGKIDK